MKTLFVFTGGGLAPVLNPTLYGVVTAARQKGWRVLADGSLMVYAKVDIEEVESFFNITFPEGPYESVGGLVINQLGYVPKSGESVEIAGLIFNVASATKRHIKTVRVSRK